MLRRSIKAQSHSIEPLEHRLLMSKSSSDDAGQLAACACPACSGLAGQAASTAPSLSDLRKLNKVVAGLNPVSIHRGAPESANEPGNVSGFVWLDQNADGELDRNEGGLFNQVIYLDENNNGALDDAERSTQTNPNGYYVFKDVEPGSYTIRQVRWEELDVSLPGNDVYPITINSADDTIADQNFGNFLIDPIVIDHMFIYTRAARGGAGGNDEILAEIRDMIAMTNSAFVNSQINIRVNLVAARQTDYVEALSQPSDLTRMWARGEGFMADIHNLRDEFGADTVSLIEQEAGPGEGGLAFLPQRDSKDPSRLGFSVINRTFSDLSALVFTHELGHNLGAGHDFSQGLGGTFSFSYGWRIEVNNNNYRTIMTYPVDRDFSTGSIEKPLPVFSNPNISYKGVALGDAQVADNARTIRRMASLVANYRDRDQAGSTRKTAYNFGTFDEGRIGVIRDSVGDGDGFDVYKLKLDEPAHLTSRLFRLRRNAELQVLQGNRVIESSRKPGQKPERIELNLDPGTYFVRVYHGGGKTGTSYTLKLIGEAQEESVQARQRVATAAAASSLFDKRNDEASEEDEKALVDLV